MLTESSVMQIHFLDNKGKYNGRTVYLLMDDKLNWVDLYLKRVCRNYDKLSITCRKVQYVS